MLTGESFPLLFPQKNRAEIFKCGPEALSYYEFVAHALGLKATVVELALYDLSQGVAQWVPSALLGALHSFPGKPQI